MNLEPAASSVVVEDVGHVHHSGVIHVKLANAQHPRQLHPLDEQRRRDVSERDGDANSELDVRFCLHWTLDGNEDGRLGTSIDDDRHVRRNRISARQPTRKQILHVGSPTNNITSRSADDSDFYRRDERIFVFRIPRMTVECPVVQLGNSEDTNPRRNPDSRPVVEERRVQHQFTVAAGVLDLPRTVGPHGVRQRTPQIRTRFYVSVRCPCFRENVVRVKPEASKRLVQNMQNDNTPRERQEGSYTESRPSANIQICSAILNAISIVYHMSVCTHRMRSVVVPAMKRLNLSCCGFAFDLDALQYYSYGLNLVCGLVLRYQIKSNQILYYCAPKGGPES